MATKQLKANSQKPTANGQPPIANSHFPAETSQKYAEGCHSSFFIFHSSSVHRFLFPVPREIERRSRLPPRHGDADLY